LDKNVKSNWNGIRKMVEEVEKYQIKELFKQHGIGQILHSGYKL
jgi:hypothetical protein